MGEKDEEKDAKDEEEKKDEKDGKDEEKKDEKDGKDEEKKDEKDAKEEEEKKDGKDAKEDEEKKDGKDSSRLFDNSISLTFTRRGGSSAVACFLGAALAGFVGLVAMFRRGGSRESTANWEGGHESLAMEDSEQDA